MKSALADRELEVAALRAKLDAAETLRVRAANIVVVQTHELANARRMIEEQSDQLARASRMEQEHEELLITVLGHFRVKTVDELLTLAENFKSEMVERMVRAAHEHVLAQISREGVTRENQHPRKHAENLEDYRFTLTMHPYEPQVRLPNSTPNDTRAKAGLDPLPEDATPAENAP